LKLESKYSVNPLYPALERFAFFRVSKLTHRGPERQCNPARDRNPAKGKPLLRQGADGNCLRAGDISLNSLTEAPAVFPAFAVGETASPERSVKRMQRGQDIPHVKGLKKTGG